MDGGVAAAKRNPESVPIGLFLQALNAVMDLHTNRVNVGLRDRIPNVIWAVLYAATALAMALVGYHLGIGKSRRSIGITTFALVYSVVLVLVVDLDRPREGLITVSQRAMEDLRATMKP